MSVIFKTLAKLKNQSADEKERSRRSKRRGNVYSFRKMLISPPLLISVSAVVFLIGFGALYGVDYYRGYIEAGNRGTPAAAEKARTRPEPDSQKEVGEPTAVKETAQTEMNDIPPLPDQIPVEEPKPEESHIPSGRLIRSVAAREPSSAINNTGSGTEHVTANAEKTAYVAQAASNRKVSGDVYEHPRGFILTKRESAAPAGYALLSPDRATKADNVAATANHRKPSNAGKTKGERIHLANIKKQFEISKLVSEIEKSMRRNTLTGDDDNIEDCLKRLASIKGEDYAYVLKVRAYWYLRKKEYASAALLLEKVLDENENDIEAGINMAIIEVNRDQGEKARKRLRRLKGIYPENTRIPEILAKLKK